MLISTACAWLLGLMWSSWTQPTLSLIYPTIALACATLAAAKRGSTSKPVRRIWTIVLAVTAFVIGACAATKTSPRVPPSGLASMNATVEQVEERNHQLVSIVRVISGHRLEDKKPLPKGIRVLVLAELPLGQTLQLLARLSPRAPYRNISPHPSWPTEPIVAVARPPPTAEHKVIRESPVNEAMHRARNAIRARLANTLDSTTARVAKAMILGESGALSTLDNQRLREAGLAHVIAVSGMHITVLAGFMVWLLRMMLLRIPHISARVDTRKWALACGIPLALGYAAFAGGTPSGWRAAATSALTWALIFANRRPKIQNVTAATVILFGLLSPDEAIRPAFALSFLSTSALLSIPQTNEEHLASVVHGAFRLSTRAILATAPVTVWCFESLPIVGIFANMLLVPIASLILLPLAAFHTVIALWVPGISWLSGELMSTATHAFLAVTDVFATATWGQHLPPLSIAQGVCFSFGCFTIVFASSPRTKWITVGMCMLFMGIAELDLRRSEQPHNQLRVTILDVGQGDSALVDLPDGKLLLIDAGGGWHRSTDPGTRVLLPLLRARRRSRIDVAVVTHPHPDHFGGIHSLLGKIKIGEIWDTHQAETEEPNGSWSRTLAEARIHGTRVVSPSSLCSRQRQYGGAIVDVLWPCPAFDSTLDPNDNSFVIRIQYKHRSMLFTGDVERSAEQSLLALKDHLRADILKVPHHGSRTSSSLAFLKLVNPKIATISAGTENRFGHPHTEVLERLHALHIRVFRTDIVGSSVISTHGDDLMIRTWHGTSLEL